YNIGFSMIGLGNVHYYLKNFDSALLNYRLAKEYMLEANDEDLLCEINLGMARVFQSVQMKDSASFYAKEALFLSQKDNFLSRELNASVFLASMYSNQKKMDSAYYYLSKANILKDTLLGEEKTRFSEQIKFNENIRQQQQIEEAILQKETRRQQLQLILIALFIPLLFILTILLSRRRIKTSLIKFLGIISLLFFFEFITLLLHPLVEELTHHTPFLEILIFVAIAGIIIPTHHRIEHWLIELLIKRSISKERNRQI
ncbi:MAG: hypothetical protein R2831_08735, partial [Chitinophagaceae bacterium]